MDEQNLDAQEEQQEEQSQEQLEPTNEQHIDNEESQPEEEQAEQEEQPEPSKEDDSLSPRQQKRVDQIEEKAKELKFTKILDRIENSRKPQESQQFEKDLLNYEDALNADEDTLKTLRQDREAASQRGYSQGLEQAKAIEWKTNIRLDVPQVKDRLDKLDPVDAQAIDREYLYYSGYDPSTGTVRNPDLSYADFVEARVEQAERLAQRLTANEKRNIAKQAATTGVRPTGGTASRTPVVNSAEDIAKMSNSEWEKHREAVLKQLGINETKPLF